MGPCGACEGVHDPPRAWSPSHVRRRGLACLLRLPPVPDALPLPQPTARARAGEWPRKAEASGREPWRSGREGGEEGVGGGGIRRGPGRQVHKLLTTAAAAMMPPHRRRKMATRAAASPNTLSLAALSRVFVTRGKFVKNAVVWRGRRRLRRHGGRAFDHQRNRLRRPGGRDGGSCGECLRLSSIYPRLQTSSLPLSLPASLSLSRGSDGLRPPPAPLTEREGAEEA